MARIEIPAFLKSCSGGEKCVGALTLGWIKSFQQEAAVVKYADSDIANLLVANGEETPLGKWSINRLASIYSQMRAGADTPNRMFVFEAADDHSWSARLAMNAMGSE